jgi:hypothetical protein
MQKFQKSKLNKLVWTLYKLDFVEISVGGEGERFRFTQKYMTFTEDVKKYFSQTLEKEVQKAKESQNATCETSEIRDCVGHLAYSERMEETAYENMFPGIFTGICMDFAKQFRIEILKNLAKGMKDKDMVLKYSIAMAISSCLMKSNEATIKTGEIYNDQDSIDEIIEDMKKN